MESRSSPAWSWQQDAPPIPEARDERREQSAALLDRGTPQAEISACDQYRSQL